MTLSNHIALSVYQIKHVYLKEKFTVENTQKLNGEIGKVLRGAVTSKWLNATAILCLKKGNTSV